MLYNAVLLFGRSTQKEKSLAYTSWFRDRFYLGGVWILEEEEVMIQASFLTSRVGLKLFNKVKKKSNKHRTFSFLRTSVKYPSDKK